MKNKKSAAFSFETRRILNYGVRIVSFQCRLFFSGGELLRSFDGR